MYDRIVSATKRTHRENECSPSHFVYRVCALTVRKRQSLCFASNKFDHFCALAWRHPFWDCTPNKHCWKIGYTHMGNNPGRNWSMAVHRNFTNETSKVARGNTKSIKTNNTPTTDEHERNNTQQNCNQVKEKRRIVMLVFAHVWLFFSLAPAYG